MPGDRGESGDGGGRGGDFGHGSAASQCDPGEDLGLALRIKQPKAMQNQVALEIVSFRPVGDGLHCRERKLRIGVATGWQDFRREVDGGLTG